MTWTCCDTAGWVGCSAGSPVDPGQLPPHVPGFGHVRQLDKVAAGVLVNLAAHTPLLNDAAQMALVDLDDTVKATYGYAKQGAGYGYSKLKGLNAPLGIISTLTSAPVIAATGFERGVSTRPAGRSGWSPTRWSPRSAAGRPGWS